MVLNKTFRVPSITLNSNVVPIYQSLRMTTSKHYGNDEKCANFYFLWDILLLVPPCKVHWIGKLYNVKETGNNVSPSSMSRSTQNVAQKFVSP